MIRIILLGVVLSALILFSSIGITVVQTMHQGVGSCLLSITGFGTCPVLTSGIALITHHMNGFNTLIAGVITFSAALLAVVFMILGNVLRTETIFLETRSVICRRSIEPMRGAYAPLIRFLALRTRRIPDVYSGCVAYA